MSKSVTNAEIIEAFRPWRKVKPSQYTSNCEFLEEHLPKLVALPIDVSKLEEGEKLSEWKRIVQVWSLTRFYSVDFSQSAFSTNAQSRFASVAVDGVLGPPRLARHT